MVEKRSKNFIWTKERATVDDHPSDTQRNARPRYWTPIELRRWTLLIFCVVIVVLVIVLGVLALYSKHHNGINSANSRDHYLWTYGPTAVFTLVALYWSQVEYHTKQLQPWVAMQDGFRNASRSVLLDFISPLNFVVLGRAIRNKNTLPALGVFGSLLIKVITVLSTGLFVMQKVDVTSQNIPLTVTERFGIADHSFWNNQSASLESDADFRPTMAVVALAQHNLTLQPGTTSTNAFQRFTTQNVAAGAVASLEATVGIFESSLDCELASFDAEWIWGTGVLTGPYFNASSVSSETCKNATITGYVSYVWPWEFAAFEFQSSYSTVKCSEFPADDTVDGKRILFYIGGLFPGPKHLVLNSTDSGNSSAEASSNQYANTKLAPRISALLCYPKYGVYQAPVTINQGGHAIMTPVLTGQGADPISGLAPWALAKAFLGSITSSELFLDAGADRIKGGKNWTVATDSDNGNHGYLWELLNIVSPQRSVVDWIDTALVNRTLQGVWSTWSAQLAAFQLKTAGSQDVTGSVTMKQSRLVLQTVSFWLIEAGMLVLILTAIALVVVTPKDVVPRNTASLGGIVPILASSEGFRETIRGSWNYNDIDLREKLDHHYFAASIEPPENGGQSPKFCINEKLNPDFKPPANRKPGKVNPWWYPTGAMRWYQIVAPIWIVVLIGLLEGLYQLSIHADGIVTIVNPTKYIHFSWTTLPSLIMVLTAAAVGTLHFATRVLQPFKLLRHGSVSARNGLFKYPFSGPRLSALAETFRDQEYAVMASTASVFLASFLTIVISGLYTPQYVTATAPASINQRDWFAHNTTLNNNSPIQIEAVTVGNLSYPRFTHAEFVLPTLAAQEQAIGSLNLQVPALRSFLNCSVFPQEDIVSINNTWYEGRWKDIVSVFIEDRANCFAPWDSGGNFAPLNCTSPSCGKPRKGQVQIDTTAKPYSDTKFSDGYYNMPPTGYFGYLDFGQYVDVGVPISADCPKAFGVVGRSAHHRIEEVTVFSCSPYVTKVMLNATFNAPSMDIDTTSPPVEVSGSSESFKLTFEHQPAHGADLPYFPNPMAAFDQIQLPNMDEKVNLGPFMDVLVYGTRGIPISELVGPTNVQRLFSAVDRLYGVGFAQLMTDYRTPLASGTQLKGIRSYQGAYRLGQNELSTRILEGLLGAILICMILGFFAMDNGKTLKHNPCTIAGMASLLSDSDCLANGKLPDGAEWWTDEKLLKHAVFEGWMFSLGWWRVPGTANERRFGVDIGRADKEP